MKKEDDLSSRNFSKTVRKTCQLPSQCRAWILSKPVTSCSNKNEACRPFARDSKNPRKNKRNEESREITEAQQLKRTDRSHVGSINNTRLNTQATTRNRQFTETRDDDEDDDDRCVSHLQPDQLKRASDISDT